MEYSQESQSETSKVNDDEVKFIEQLVKKFINLLVENDKTNPNHKKVSGVDIVNNFKKDVSDNSST